MMDTRLSLGRGFYSCLRYCGWSNYTTWAQLCFGSFNSVLINPDIVYRNFKLHGHWYELKIQLLLKYVIIEKTNVEDDLHKFDWLTIFFNRKMVHHIHFCINGNSSPLQDVTYMYPILVLYEIFSRFHNKNLNTYICNSVKASGVCCVSQTRCINMKM